MKRLHLDLVPETLSLFSTSSDTPVAIADLQSDGSACAIFLDGHSALALQQTVSRSLRLPHQLRELPVSLGERPFVSN